MSHLPRNHPLRPLYRFLAALVGAYCVAFGIGGVAAAGGYGAFDQAPVRVLGLRTNLAFSLLSISIGTIVFAAAITGHNVDRWVNFTAGPTFIVAGLVMMTLMHSPANFLNFGMSTCIVSFIIGLLLLAAALYGHTNSATEASRHEAFRQGAQPDPDSHPWGPDPTRTPVR
jgi:hypothetical protein